MLETTEDTNMSETSVNTVSEFHNYGFRPPEGGIQPINESEEPSIIFQVGNSVICPYCERVFTKLCNLKRHMKNKHNVLANTRYPPENYPQKCDVCKKYYKDEKAVRSHYSRVHKKYNFPLKKHKCPLCPELLRKRHMGEHFEKTHGLLLKPIKVCFDSYEEFCEWKKAIERVTKNYFTKLHNRTTNGTVIHMLGCHRSGTFKSLNENKRKLKAQGSKKIDAYCPAAMRVTVTKEGKCEVAFQSQHLGHENELQHLSLTNEDKKYIAEKLATNLPLDEILKDIRNSASQVGFERLTLLTRKDLRNIKTSLFMEKQLYLSSTKLYEDFTNCLRDIHNKHTDSAHIKADIARIEIGWVLTYIENNEIHLIRKMMESCDCPLVCTHCKICIKKYICSCPNSSVEGNMCKHIHFFHMEVNKMHDVSIRNDCPDSNNNSDSVDFNDSLITEVVSNPEQCGDVFQTSNTLHIASKSLNTDKSNTTTFVNSEENRNILKNKFSDLVDSIKSAEEYRLFESILKELTDKLKPIQDQGHSKAEGAAVIPATDHSSLPGPVNKNIPNQNNSNSPITEPTTLSKKNIPNQNSTNASLTEPKALILQVNDPTTQSPKYFYILAQQN